MEVDSKFAVCTISQVRIHTVTQTTISEWFPDLMVRWCEAFDSVASTVSVEQHIWLRNHVFGSLNLASDPRPATNVGTELLAVDV